MSAIAHPPPRRLLWGFSRKPQRETKDADIDPGFPKMLELSTATKNHTRPPPTTELVKAFKDFFRARQMNLVPLEEIQALHAIKTYKYLRERKQNEPEAALSTDDLQVALSTLIHMPRVVKSGEHNTLARMLFEDIREEKEAAGPDTVAPDPRDSKYILSYIKVLTQTGESAEARKLVEKVWRTHLEAGGRAPWTYVLKGFAKEQNEHEMLHTIEMMEKYGVPFDAKTHQAVTIFYATKGDIEATKQWYTHAIADGGTPTHHTNAFVLKLCIQKNELAWGDAILKSMLETNPDKRAWNLILLWAAAQGKGVDEIERMMEVMVRRNEGKNNVRPDIETINGLIEFANSRDDPYTAERYVALGQKWNISPNAQTYLLQLDYRIKVGDLDGAKVAYSKLQAEEVPENKDIPLINKLIVALCSAQRLDYDTVISIAEDLNERKARLEAETVRALCLVHLRRDELHDVIDLLQTHTFHYSLDERARVRDLLVDFCLDRKNSTSRAWDAYTIFRQIFGDTPISIRTKVMNDFFARGRADMACHVFGHMRQHDRPERRPTLDTYVECFEGIAQAAKPDALDMVHNMLKMDSAIEPNTRLYNALMLAYTACEMPDRSLEFWEDITNSIEGPTYSSIQIALRACEEVPFGDRQARSIWARLRRMDIEITREIYAAYVGAIAGSGFLDEAKTLVDDMEKEVGCKPDDLVYGPCSFSILTGSSPSRYLWNLTDTKNQIGHHVQLHTRPNEERRGPQMGFGTLSRGLGKPPGSRPALQTVE